MTPRSVVELIGRHYRQGGVSQVLASGWGRMRRLGLLPKLDPAHHLHYAARYSETRPLLPPAGKVDTRQLKLNWLIPEWTPGLGGHFTICRIVQFLEGLGHEHALWVVARPSFRAPPERMRERLSAEVLPVQAQVRFCDDPAEIEGDAVIATSFPTAYLARHVTRVRHRFYFVQDYEPWFFPRGTEYLLAEHTYRLGYSCIVAGAWLEGMLLRRHGLKSHRFDLAVDHAIYQPSSMEERQSGRIAVYARLNTPRRAVELALLALERIHRQAPELHVDFFSSDTGKLSIPYAATHHGVLTPLGLARLYQTATLGLVFSATNYSLVPQEMMACGLPVLDLRGESTEAAYAPGTVTLCEPSVEGVTDAVVRLLESADRRKTQADTALLHVRALNWEASGKAVEAAIVSKLLP